MYLDVAQFPRSLSNHISGNMMPTRPTMSKRTGKKTGWRFAGGIDVWMTEFMTASKGSEPAQLTFSFVHLLVSSGPDDFVATPWNVK